MTGAPGSAHLFFYGVLQPDLASARIAPLLAGLGPGRRATTAGRLYAVPGGRGWYPVLVPGEGRVCGIAHLAGSVDLAALDRFEGVDPGERMKGEYRRETIRVTLAGDGAVPVTDFLADAYLYNRSPAAAFERIAHGDFGRWLRETGRSALSG